MLQGGTSGIGAEVVRALARQGAQLILLTHHAPSDPFLVEFIMDLRTQTNNELIYAEQADLSSLHSIRLFATKWIDNAPPRRLDMLILCAATLTPPFTKQHDKTQDGVEANWGINYLANFHLLSILSPAIRAQPPDRDVRIIMATCSSYVAGRLDLKDETFQDRGFSSKGKPQTAYGASKLALMIFAHSFQKHLTAILRADKLPPNARVLLVDPSWTRTPGMRRFLSAGSLWGLLLYLLTWPFWWLVLKSPQQGAQSFLRAAMDPEFGEGVGGWLLRECKEARALRPEVGDEVVGKELWELSEKMVQRVEREGVERRRKEKQASGDKDVPGEERKTSGADKSSSTGSKPSSSAKRNRKAA
jgi:NAD(P)-dependent dehydrogenase (short-subunit alcohol dehydrogenase family)